MQFLLDHRDNTVIFHIKDRTIESQVSAEFKAKILIHAQPDIDALIINMDSVEAIDSSGLGALLLANRQLKDHAIPVILVGVKSFVRSLMSMTHIDEVFEFFDTIDEALEWLKEGGIEE